MKTIRMCARLVLLLLLLALPVATAGGCGLLGGGYVRLRGSSEIHERGCPKLRGAPSEGIVDADDGDGPPCFTCRRDDAIEWAED